jgi:2-succinyl-6-hydroxy-2,4-cyclohexadiene-1-carboxylate synthase
MIPLFFLHGFLGSSLDWTEIVQLLSPRFSCYPLDLPWQEKLNFNEAVLHLKDQIKALNVSPGVLVSYSLGGRLGLKLASLFPELFSHCIFLSTHPGIEEEELRRLRATKDQAWIDLVQKEGVERFLKKWYAQPLFSSLKMEGDLLQRRQKCPKNAIAWVLKHWSASCQEPLWETLCAQTTPTLFLFGKEDLQYHAVYNRIFDLGSPLQVEWIEDAAHAIHIEQPRSCAHAITSFIDRTRDVDLL